MVPSSVLLLFPLLVLPILVAGNTHSLAFNTYDLDKSDLIEANEFYVLVHDLFSGESNNGATKRLVPKQLAKLFEMLDLTGDGYIDRIEFAKIWDHWVQPVLNPKAILLVLNMQNDYLLPNGSMYMKGADSIVGTINTIIEQEHFSQVYYVRDYHPQNHCSFNYSDTTNQNDDAVVVDEDQYYEESIYDCQICNLHTQVIWPKHCIQGTAGAEFYSGLVIKKESAHVRFINKGTEPTIDSYSAIFDNSGNPLALHRELRQLEQDGDIVTIFVVGVMLEFEIASTALDAVDLGHPTVVLRDAVWSKDSREEADILEALRISKLIFANSDEVYSMLNGRDRKLEAGFVLANRLYQKYQGFRNYRS